MKRACARCGQTFGLSKSKHTGEWYCVNILACDARLRYRTLAQKRVKPDNDRQTIASE